MLKVIAALLVVVPCVKSQGPPMWGSQIITQERGSVAFYLSPKADPSDCYMDVYPTEYDYDRYTFKINQKYQICTFLNGSLYSAPCSYDSRTFQMRIIVKDVRAQRKVTVRSKTDDTINITLIFAPYCKFAAPGYEQIFPEASAPLMKFVKGLSVVPIKFAVKGNICKGMVKLLRNNKLLCEWEGIKYISGDGCGKQDLRPDYMKDMRVFETNLSTGRGYYDHIKIVTRKDTLLMHFDNLQAGESKEMAACKHNAISPKLWGSQIITQKTGPVTLNLEPEGQPDQILIIKEDMCEAITIDLYSDKCFNWRGTEWSAPCCYENAKLQITVKDVTAQDKVLIYSPEPYFTQLSVVFAPGCKFPALKQDEFVAKESAPLSKFVRGQSDVMIRFAIVGADSQSEVSMWKNGKLLCKWKGIEYASGDGCGRINLIKDDVNNWRVFKETFPVPYYVDYYAFHTPISELMVTVDATKIGESTEMADC